MPRVLVTGGAGFVGSNVARLAQHNGWDVRILDNLSTGLKATCNELREEGIEIVIGDLRDKETVEQAVRGCDVIVNLAAQVSVPYSMAHPEENHEINVNGTAFLIEACKTHKIQRFITASSAAVYGTKDSMPLKEEDAGEFHSPYAESKWKNEIQVIDARMGGLHAIALRFFNVYGNGQRSDGAYAAVIPKFIELMANDQPPVIFGDGKQTRDFVHVNDVAGAIMMFATETWDDTWSSVYNLATQTERSLVDLVATINEVLSQHKSDYQHLQPIFRDERAGDIRTSVGCIDRILEETNWAPQTSFEQGLEHQIITTLANM
ncbi:MAG: SDR family NAD(P)-dependent oxidoreductase [Candidatus Poseidonia sp.]|nr:SDR family NAD(P)-dependent oxidoreductase [Poseidonia sp.]